MASPRLSCCVPTAYDGGSRTIVHSLACVTPEATLSGEEYALYRSQLAHPARYSKPSLSVVTQPVTSRKPRRSREWWDVGFRDPDLEDFA